MAIDPSPPTSRPAIAALFTLAVATMYVVSGGVLWVLGVNYDGLTGAIASKIHPATYLAFATFALLMVARRNPVAFLARFVTRYPGALAFLAATVALAAYILLDNRRGIATVFDTYILAVVMWVTASELHDRDLVRIEKLLHVFFALNAVFALVEYGLDHRFFPYRFEGLEYQLDRRSAAFLGHPLSNAVITGAYVMALMGGGGTTMPRLLRAPAVLLQVAALVPFGGRTALLLTGAMLAFWLLWRGVEVLRGKRLSLLAIATIAMIAPALALAVGGAAMAGFFDVIAERFADDNGSALTRVEMFEVFHHLSWQDIIIGGDWEMVESIRRTRGLQTGVENPVVRLVLYQGAAFTCVLLAGFVLFLVEIGRRLRPGAAMAFVFFLIVINSFESISNKSIMLAQFVVLMIAMFRPEPEPVQSPQRYRPAAIAWA
jgi:hypothetical protein